MKKIMLFMAAMASLVMGASYAQAATLLGKTVMVNLTAGGSNHGTQSVVVGAGNDGNFFGNTFFDLDGGPNGDQFIYTSGGVFCGLNCRGDVVWTLSGLDFGTPLTGFTILQQGIAPISIVSLTADSVSFKYSDVSITSGVNVVGQFVTTSAVPEPATWAMMVLGFGLIGLALRKRTQAKPVAQLA